MEKIPNTEKLILENLNKRKMTFTLIFVLIIFSGFLLFNQLPGVAKYIKKSVEKEKKEKVIYSNLEINFSILLNIRRNSLINLTL